MQLHIGKHILVISLTLSAGWKDKVFREVERMQRLYPDQYGITFTEALDGTLLSNAKIQRIKAVRHLAAWFPENEREYGNTEDLLGLRFSKEFVEANWGNNGYGDPINKET
jgi:hypothetical protein